MSSNLGLRVEIVTRNLKEKSWLADALTDCRRIMSVANFRQSARVEDSQGSTFIAVIFSVVGISVSSTAQNEKLFENKLW